MTVRLQAVAVTVFINQRDHESIVQVLTFAAPELTDKELIKIAHDELEVTQISREHFKTSVVVRLGPISAETVYFSSTIQWLRV